MNARNLDISDPNSANCRKSSTSRGENSFRCGKCPKSFSHRANLSRHLKTHDSAKAHLCSTCGKRFTRSDILSRHELLHNAGTPEVGSELLAMEANKRRRVGSPGAAVVQHLPAANDFPKGPEAFQDLQQPLAHGDGLQDPFSFDFSSFFSHDDDAGWFTEDFYAAMRETGNEWDTGNSIYSDLTPNSTGLDFATEENTGDASNKSRLSEQRERAEVVPNREGRISRLSSPPNEASEEDRWPFAWDPNSRQVLRARPITISQEHTLMRNHETRFDINVTTYNRIKAFLGLSKEQCTPGSKQKHITFPSLQVVNLFVELYFRHFAPQMPFIHIGTLQVDTLPSQLLSAIIVIGAIYSHLPHTRRFSIVLLDIARQMLQSSIEQDNNLMRDPMIIFATTLICYTGLWCGNKRAFEFAEVGRGAVITYIRRMGFSRTADKPSTGSDTRSLDTQWRQWIAGESRNRLVWIVYAFDLQFPGLLNLPSTISISELTDLGCPCDEEFWCASTAKAWKRHLGPAHIPPSRSFTAAISPFLLSSAAVTTEDSSRNLPSYHGSHSEPLITLNSWSRFLVVITIQNQVFEFSQQFLVQRAVLADEFMDGEDEVQSDVCDPRNSQLGAVKNTLATSLALWWDTYHARSPKDHWSQNTTSYFHACSLLVYRLSFLYLSVTVTDLQNAIGKSGQASIPDALFNIQHWARRSPNEAKKIVLEALDLTDALALDPQRTPAKLEFVHVETGPYRIITFFLSNVVLWAYSTVADAEQKQALLQELNLSELVRSASLNAAAQIVLSVWPNENGQRGLGGPDRFAEASSGRRSPEARGPKLVFKSAAEALTRLATWGASLNLAMLLHWRAEM